MDFFEQLRKLAQRVQGEAIQLRQLSANPQQRHEKEHDGSAVLLLIEKQKEAKKLKSEVQHLLRTIQDDNNFVNLVEAASALTDKNAQILGETITHLQQYGYQPPAAERPEHPVVKDAEGYDDKESTQQSTRLPQPVQSYKASKDETSDIPFRLPPTPTLADFGISQETLHRIQAGYVQPLVDKNLLKMPLPVAGELPKSHEEIQNCESRIRHPSNTSEASEGLPEDFRYLGGCSVTPGLLNGASLQTPAHRALQRLDMGSPCLQPGPPRQGMASLSSESSPTMMGHAAAGLGQTYVKAPSQASSLASYTDSPTPPTFQTPGIKQITKSCIMTTLDKQQENHPKPQFNLEEGSSESPVIPVFQTPGVKQLKKVIVEKGEKSKSKTVECSSSLNIDPDDMPTPEMPQMTMNLKDLQWSSSTVTKTSVIKETNDTFEGKSLTRPHMTSALSDFGTPQMPELTGSYRFPTEVPKDPIGESDKENTRPTDEPDCRSMAQTNNKPQKHPVANAESCSIRPVSVSEFSTQPDYIVRNVPLEFLNSCVEKMNSIISQQSAGTESTLVPADMQIHLGPRTRLVFLTLIKLGRIQEKKNEETTVYSVVSS